MRKRLIFGFVLCSFGLFFCKNVSAQTSAEAYTINQQKMSRLLQLIRFFYVDTVNISRIVEKGTIEMLKELDPHSVYIPKQEVARTNEPLQGNFEGIGVQFQIIKDTVVVVAPIKGGPSEKVGIIAGDKIILIDDSVATGEVCTNAFIYSKLRGKKDTKVNLKIRRGKNDDLLNFTVIRDKIPIHSIESYFMIDKETGYIQLDRFSQTTIDEFKKALRELKASGMKNLIFDLRGNTGGYLNAAVELVDELLEKGKLVVYTQNNQDGNKTTYNTRRDGLFEKGKLVILIDEYSASASEIVSGAIQDWDRGIIIGRRSFGKGLVQTPVMLPDSSFIRLTTSRYYIPSGRCIQKPYEKVEDYRKDLVNRYNAGELTHADSIHFPDSLKYHTANNRTVYGGGGIMPDIFIPMDTIKVSDYYWKLFRNNIFNTYIMIHLENEKQNLLKKYPSIEDFEANFSIDENMLKDFYSFAEKEGVKDSMAFDFKSYLHNFYEKYKDTLNTLFTTYDEVKDENGFSQMLDTYIDEEISAGKKRNQDFDTEKYIRRQLKTLFARNLYNSNKATKIWLETDETYQKAIDIINDNQMFKKMKIKY